MTEVTVNLRPQSGEYKLYSSTNQWLPITTQNPHFGVLRLRSFKPYVRRVRPPVPALSPTEQLVGRMDVLQGACAYKTRTYNWSGGGSRYYTAQGLHWVPVSGTWTPSLFQGIVARLGGAYWIPIISIDSEQLAQNDLLSKLAEMQISGPTTVAEAAETSSWLATRARDMAVLTKATYRRDWKTFRETADSALQHRPPTFVNINTGVKGRNGRPPRMPKEPPSTWARASSTASERYLEVRYAMTPLMYEAEAYAKWLAGLWEDYESLTKVEGESWRFYEGQIDVKPVFWPPSSGGTPGIAPSGRMLWRGRIVNKRTAMYRVVDYQKRMYASLGATYSDLSAAAWEVVPWSFVLDWGISFGDYLDLLSADVGLEYVAGWKNSNLKAQVRESAVSPGDALLWSASEPYSALRMNWRNTAGPPRPYVVIRSAYGTKQMLDSIALLRTLRKFS